MLPQQAEANAQTDSHIIAAGVSLDDYMAHYAAEHCEWVEGVVIKVAANALQHITLERVLYILLAQYFGRRALGQIIGQPFVMRLPAFPNRRREPDLLAVMHSNPARLEKTFLDGAANLVIEIVSEGSAERDRGEKFVEYETGGVEEYWVIDYLREDVLFYRLEDGLYARQPIVDGHYRTPLLPDFSLEIAFLWRESFPLPSALAAMVDAMLGSGDPGAAQS
ncbi:MAG: Uma2 family endonuclease [Chloroflexota bacterium]|nr:Uma2 family endonuclease [Chloroflexota bacterium]